MNKILCPECRKVDGLVDYETGYVICYSCGQEFPYERFIGVSERLG